MGGGGFRTAGGGHGQAFQTRVQLIQVKAFYHADGGQVFRCRERVRRVLNVKKQLAIVGLIHTGHFGTERYCGQPGQARGCRQVLAVKAVAAVLAVNAVVATAGDQRRGDCQGEQ